MTFPADAQWRNIQDALINLRNDAVMAPFVPLIEQLQRPAAAQPKVYPLEIYEVMIAALGEVRAAVEAGTAPREALARARRGQIYLDQQHWTPGTVNNAQSILNVFVDRSGTERVLAEEPRVPVPIVLMVMTASEAQDLTTGAAFKGAAAQELLSDFDQFRTVLATEPIADWLARYADTPEQWRPFGTGPGQLTIGELVTRVIDDLNRTDGFSPQLAPVFHDLRTLSDNDNRFLLRNLRNNGCVVVVDVITTRHPALQRAFHLSLLDAYPHSSVVTVAPVSGAFEAARKLSMVLQLRLAELEFVVRRTDPHEPDFGACREISDPGELRQWLGSRVRQIAPEARPDGSVRPRMTIR